MDTMPSLALGFESGPAISGHGDATANGGTTGDIYLKSKSVGQVLAQALPLAIAAAGLWLLIRK